MLVAVASDVLLKQPLGLLVLLHVHLLGFSALLGLLSELLADLNSLNLSLLHSYRDLFALLLNLLNLSLVLLEGELGLSCSDLHVRAAMSMASSRCYLSQVSRLSKHGCLSLLVCPVEVLSELDLLHEHTVDLLSGHALSAAETATKRVGRDRRILASRWVSNSERAVMSVAVLHVSEATVLVTVDAVSVVVSTAAVVSDRAAVHALPVDELGAMLWAASLSNTEKLGLAVAASQVLFL